MFPPECVLVAATPLATVRGQAAEWEDVPGDEAEAGLAVQESFVTSDRGQDSGDHPGTWMWFTRVNMRRRHYLSHRPHTHSSLLLGDYENTVAATQHLTCHFLGLQGPSWDT